jgi:predicted alpha/beta superfamily hydrolase
MLREYPTVFGACAAVSPSLWWDDKRFIDDARADLAWARGARIWLDMGTAEAHDDPEKSKLRVSEVADFARLLENSGLRPGKDLVWAPVEGADHSESAWSARFDRILTFLYGK